MKGVRQYFWMLAANAAICAYWVYYRSVCNVQRLPYPHFLVDYSFGFTRRALIGQIVSFFYPQVPITVVFVSATITLVCAIALYLLLFRRDFGFTRASLPLLVLIVGSPFFFKNFFYNLGYFDALGCIAAIIALLLPVNRLYPALLAAAAIVLILIHHIQFLLYVPTIAAIGIIRYVIVPRRFGIAPIAYLCVAATAVLAAFTVVVFHGDPQVPRDVFLAHMKARALDPFAEYFVQVWYSTPQEEFQATLQKLPRNLVGIPAYILLVLAHWPLLEFYRGKLRALADRDHRRIVVAMLGAIALGYLGIFAMVFDYSRWVSSWAICMVLMLHAISRLPSAAERSIEDAPRTRGFAWLVTLIPRIGTVRPF